MKLPGVPYTPRYANDETRWGIIGGLGLHVVVGVIVGWRWIYAALCVLMPSSGMCTKAAAEEEKPLVARPVVQASLLKLGKPIDPKKLPDRVVPQARTAPKKQLVASQEDPGKKVDAGAPPPPNTQDSDIANLVTKTDPFAEPNAKARPEEGHESGVDGGTETDPNKVHAGDMYAMQLGKFLGDRLQVPTVISVAEERRLCAIYEVNIGRNMVIWHVATSPVKTSGNELFDDSGRSMLLKLLDDKTPLPQPPKEVDELYRGRRVQIIVPGKNGDPSRCTK